MSSIEKLSVRGIRSFSPHAQSVIEFYTPLTLIVGPNGAGKTTIIECLKYATTGDLPPNSKGGAFVNDPKLSRESEVKAQIKLKFRNINGASMVVTRSLQSTQKRSKLEQKTLEGLLVTVDPETGEQVSISTRCAELDAEIPAHLGVSRPILENVIFCHQEESYWPLSEPGVLKKKFDDIFAATGFTKALDEIKGIRKNLASDAKLEQQKLDFLRSDLEKAKKLHAARASTEQRAREAQGLVGGLDLQIETVNSTIAQLNSDLAALGSLQTELERLQHEQAVANQSKQDLLSSVREMTEKDEELAQILQSQSSIARRGEAEVQRREAERDCQVAQASEASKALAAVNTQKGVLLSELQTLQHRCHEREAAINAIAQALGLSLPQASPDDNKAFLDALSACTAMLDQRHQEYRKSVEMAKAEEKSQADSIQRLVTRSHTLEESRRMRRKMVDENRAKLAQIVDSLSDINNASDLIADFQQKIGKEEAALASAHELFLAGKYEERLQACLSQRKQIETAIEQVNQRIAKLSHLSELRAKYDLKKADRDRKEEQANRIWNEIRNDLGSVSIETVDKEADELHRLRAASLQSVKDKLAECDRDLAASLWRQEALQRTISQARTEVDQKRMTISRACEGLSLADCISAVEDRLNRAIELGRHSTASVAFYQAQKQALDRQHACPLCDRAFASREEERKVGLKLVSLAESLPPQRMDEARQQIDDLRRQLASLNALTQTEVEISHLAAAIQQTSVELENTGDEIIVIESSKDDFESELSEQALAERKAAALKRKAEEASRLLREASGMAVELDFLKQKLSLSGSTAGAEELHSELEALQAEARGIQSEMEACGSDTRARQDEIQLLEKQLHLLKEDLMKMQLKQSDCIRLERQKIDLEAATTRLMSEISASAVEADETGKQIAALIAKHDAFGKDSSAALGIKQAELNELDHQFVVIRSIQQDIARSSERCSPERLAGLECEIGNLQASIAEQQVVISALTGQIAAASRHASEVQFIERTVLDNMKVRELARRAAEIQARAEQLAQRVGSFDKAHATAQLQRQQLGHSDLMGERSGLLGEIRQLQDQAGRFARELEADYPDADASYKRQYVRVKCTEIAIEDLERYAKALDQAIMKYHAVKMDEINKIIREIWTNTYQGADIDTIEIRADHDISGGARSYNYRVVMVKGDADLDMRGRSSAGQRVLTSLIIRLALAETFGIHCGILALDEPTTNLDHDNIESLANSLAQIIANRRMQSNFQLIIITHDEEFVQLLGHHECADYYWRVHKDEQQHSVIERQSIRNNAN